MVVVAERFRRRWERERELREIVELERFALFLLVYFDPESSASTDCGRLVR